MFGIPLLAGVFAFAPSLKASQSFRLKPLFFVIAVDSRLKRVRAESCASVVETQALNVSDLFMACLPASQVHAV